mmetsp:Transcript_23259/g.52983  ORF Transcript_23259/g.52983 Transcript_23259/m.52983 type:complete len:833 (-) Transcript_23259:77-2575(-)
MPLLEAAAAFEGVKGVSEYNHDNFLYDKKQRLTAELKKMDFRLQQAMLWRADVRALVSLTERKMENYLLVNSLFAAATVMLWTEGRLETGTPHWAVWMYVICLASTFTFLLCSVIFALHASIAAQAYMVRLLTQFARLPIPTSGDIDRARTYGQAFENQPVQQMFRIPFLGNRGRTSSLVRLNETSGDRMAPRLVRDREGLREEILADERPAEAQPSATTAGMQEPRKEQRSVTFGPDDPEPKTNDPWRKEERFDTYELDEERKRHIVHLRHIKMVKEAQGYYQTFDAYARVFMVLGINQLLVSLAYYALGLAMFQHGSAYAAISGVLIFLTAAQLLLVIDVSWTAIEQALAAVILAAGPLCTLMACINWFVRSESWHIWLFIAFFSHGVWMLYMLHMCDADYSKAGAPMPLRFRAVLYMDVFGWMHHEHEHQKRQVTDSGRLDSDLEEGEVLNCEGEGDGEHDLRGFGTRGSHRLEKEALWPSTFMDPPKSRRTEDLLGGGDSGGVVQDTKQWRAMIPVLIFQVMVIIMAFVWFAGAFWALFEESYTFSTMPSIHDRQTRSTITGYAHVHHERDFLLQTPAVEVLQGRAATVPWPNSDFEPDSIACGSNGMVLLADRFSAYTASVSGRNVTGFAPIKCAGLDQAGAISSVAMGCPHGQCSDFLFLSDNGKQLTTCSGNVSQVNAVKSGWLASREQVLSVAHDGTQILLGTSEGRIVKMGASSTDSSLVPVDQITGGHAEHKTLLSLSVGTPKFPDALLALDSSGQLSAADRTSQSAIGSWRLPRGKWTAACASGSSLVALRADQEGPALWVMELPSTLKVSGKTAAGKLQP